MTENAQTDDKSSRITGLDAFRIIACMLVIINHCNSKVMFQLEQRTLAWYVTVTVFYVTKIAVPGFLMIAGYNLLHKKDDLPKTTLRIRRIFTVMVVCSFLYYIWRCSAGGMWSVWKNSAGGILFNFIKGFISAFWHDGITDAYWYLYMYLGLMVILPILQKLASALDKKELNYILVLTVIFAGFIPMISAFFPQTEVAGDFNIPLVTESGACVSYMILGHLFYLRRSERNAFHGKNMSGRTLRIVSVIVFLTGIIVNVGISAAESIHTGGESFLTMGEIEFIPLMAESIAVFIFLLNTDWNKKAVKAVGFFAPLTFGVYLASDFICSETHFIYISLCPHMNRLFAVAFQDLAAIVICFALTYLLRKIQFVRRYI